MGEPSRPTARVAYFSMEINVHPDVPTYAGGLGMLAGDTIRSAADLGVPMVAVTLLHRAGYFRQRLDETGQQTEEPARWIVEDFANDTGARCRVLVGGRPVVVRAWRFDVDGLDGTPVPVLLLDTDLPENEVSDRHLTDTLYGGDDRYRLCQEVVLGIGGVRVLRELGYQSLDRFHLNEGHAALLVLELAREESARAGRPPGHPEVREAVRRACVFTTHTPVPAGHDQFGLDLVDRVLGEHAHWGVDVSVCHEGRFNMTYLALASSHYVNGVAKRHGETSQHMYAPYQIDAITNGVHLATWASPAIGELLDRHVPGWRSDNYSLRYAMSIPTDEILEAHRRAKRDLFEFVDGAGRGGLDPDVLTIGFARRSTAYKRPDLVFADPARLKAIARDVGRLQFLFAGKAHPRDEAGKRLVQHVCELAEALGDDVPVRWLPDYDMHLARLMTSGVDVWLNTPEPPLEASGTSGMKAAINGVPSLSVLDGWWIEGCIEGVTGWAIGAEGHVADPTACRANDAGDLYRKLEERVVPTFYRDRGRFAEIMRNAMALNGSFFNTHRMLQQYVSKAYY